MADYADLAKPVIVSAAFGSLAGWLYGAARFDALPHAIAVLLMTNIALVAFIRRSKALARVARLTAAMTAAWMLADAAAHLGVPSYALLLTVSLFYRFVFASASIIGGMFGASMGPAFIFAAPIVSLMDVLMVYKSRLYFGSATLNGAVVELTASFKTFRLGFADFLWYAAAVAAAGPAKAPLAVAAIYAGLLATMRVVQRRGYAPALPIPLFLAQAALLAPIPQFF